MELGWEEDWMELETGMGKFDQAQDAEETHVNRLHATQSLVGQEMTEDKMGPHK